MRNLIPLVFFILCTEKIAAQEIPLPKFTGKVSHQFKKGGCATVVVIEEPSQQPLVLIPRTPLPKKLDKDGMKISFRYRTLRTPNPQGCIQGVPAEMTDIQKSN